MAAEQSVSMENAGAAAGGSVSEDRSLAVRILAGDESAFELLMRRNNQLLFRAARSIVQSDDDAEDVLQEAYIKAYRSLDRFEGRSSLASWLVRITVNEALNRAKRGNRVFPLAAASDADGNVADDQAIRASGLHGDVRRRPEDAAGDVELRAVLSRAVDRLPQPLRAVFVLRAVENLSVEETAQCLDLSAEAVRVRFHRAKTTLREDIDRSVTKESRRLFSFGNERCDRVVGRTLDSIRQIFG